MNVLIDLRWMEIGKAGGMEQLAYELIAALASFNTQDIIYVYCPRRTFREWALGPKSNIKPIFSDEFGLIPEMMSLSSSIEGEKDHSRKIGIIEKLTGLLVAKRIVEIDLVHSIGGYIFDSLKDYRSVVTILDLQHVHMPEFFKEWELESREQNHRDAIAASDRFICISKTVKRDVSTHYSVGAENLDAIWVIPTSLAWLHLPDAYARRTISNMGVQGEYVYFPSHAWAHKNHLALIAAFVEVRASVPNLKLVLTGGKFDTKHPAFELIGKLDLKEVVMHLGYRTPLEVRCLLQKAKLLVYPSLFEGFGLPVAEAIIAGTPVACSNIAPLREIGGEAVVTFDPRNSSEIAQKIVELATDATFRDRILTEANIRRNLFSAEKIGRETLNLYRETCGLDPIESRAVLTDPCLKHEKARHSLRLFDQSCSKRKWKDAIINWIQAFLLGPRFALRILVDKLTVKKRSENTFQGRFGDGWLGPHYCEWLMTPEDSEFLEIKLEAPPGALVKTQSFQVLLDGKHEGEYDFGREPTLVVNIRMPEEVDRLILLRIVSKNAFVPRDLEDSIDTRTLSMKLLSLKWIPFGN